MTSLQSSKNTSGDLRKAFSNVYVRLVVLQFLIAALASTILMQRFPYQTSVKFDDTQPYFTHILGIPSLAHFLLLIAILSMAWIYLKLGQKSERLLYVYLFLSLIIVISQGVLIYKLTNTNTAKVSWSIISPDQYFSKVIASEVANALKNGDLATCELFDNPHITQTVSGTTPDGLRFNKIPSQKFLLASQQGKLPVECTHYSRFESARRLSEYYPSLTWYSHDCNSTSATENCVNTTENLLKFAAPTKPIWNLNGFRFEENALLLGIYAVPDKGLLFSKRMPIKGPTIQTTDLPKFSAEAEKIDHFDIYHFDCAGRKFFKFDHEFKIGGNHWSNRAPKTSDAIWSPLPASESLVDSYFTLACK